MNAGLLPQFSRAGAIGVGLAGTAISGGVTIGAATGLERLTGRDLTLTKVGLGATAVIAGAAAGAETLGRLKPHCAAGGSRFGQAAWMLGVASLGTGVWLGGIGAVADALT